MAYAMSYARCMSQERVVKVFKNGRSQAIRIPKEFEFSEDEVVVRKDGERLIVERARKRSLHELLAEWARDPIEDELGPIDDPPAEPVEL